MMWSSDYFKCNNSKLVALMLVCCQINKNNTCVYTIATRLNRYISSFSLFLRDKVSPRLTKLYFNIVSLAKGGGGGGGN